MRLTVQNSYLAQKNLGKKLVMSTNSYLAPSELGNFFGFERRFFWAVFNCKAEKSHSVGRRSDAT